LLETAKSELLGKKEIRLMIQGISGSQFHQLLSVRKRGKRGDGQKIHQPQAPAKSSKLMPGLEAGAGKKGQTKK
jgi:hypothetical protein